MSDQGEGGAAGTGGGRASGGKGGGKASGPELKRATFHVTGPGNVAVDGKFHAPGTTLELTEQEAESLGAAVAPGKAPPAPVEIAKRKAGRYAVAAGGNVCRDGRFHPPGTMLDLDENDARTLGPAVVAAG